MSQINKTYTLGKIKQLIDLNGDSINFNINFRVTAKDSSIPFNILVVDQTTLDNTPRLNYKEVVKGVISGTITADKNVYQNYFLILKSEIPCQVDVEIIKKDLPKIPIKIQEKPIKQYDLKGTISKNWKFIALALIVIVGIGIYFWYSSTKCDNESSNDKELYFKHTLGDLGEGIGEKDNYSDNNSDGNESIGNESNESNESIGDYSVPVKKMSSGRNDLISRLRELSSSSSS